MGRRSLADSSIALYLKKQAPWGTMRQNPVLYANLLASLEGKPLLPFDPGGDYLLIFNLGHRTGVLKKRGLIMEGRLPFLLKDYIDRRFMTKFQRLEA